MSAALAALLRRMGRTERRVDALRKVAEGTVDWDPIRAAWLVGGEVKGGWDFRTFAELRSADVLIDTPAPEGDSRHSIVELTPLGRELLAHWLD